MGKCVNGVLAFNSYAVTKIVFRANADLEPNEKIPLEIEFFNDFDIDLNENMAAVSLGCSIFKERKNEHPFSLEVDLVGFFQVEIAHGSKEVERLLRINATAVLFPYLRSIISMITANSGFQTLILPIVNVHKMLEQYEK